MFAGAFLQFVGMECNDGLCVGRRCDNTVLAPFLEHPSSSSCASFTPSLLHSSGLRSITRAINSCTAGLPSCVARQDRQVPPSTRAQFIAAYRGEGGPDHVTLGRASVNVAGIKELGQTLSVALRYCEGPDRDRSSVYPQASPST